MKKFKNLKKGDKLPCLDFPYKLTVVSVEQGHEGIVKVTIKEGGYFTINGELDCEVVEDKN